MTDKNLNQNHEEAQELLRMLDRMQNRSLAPEVEDVLIRTSHPEPTPARQYASPTAQDGFDPGLPATDLSELLITPSDRQEDEEQEAARQAQLLQEQEQEQRESDPPLPAPPAQRQNPFSVLGGLLTRLRPTRTDSKQTRRVKAGLLTALVAAVAVVALLVTELSILPWANRRYNEKLAGWYRQDSNTAVTDAYRYPQGMRSAFRTLYEENNEVMGWLSFHSNDGADLIDMEYPIVQTDNNDAYVDRDLHGRYNRNGTLFFAADNRIEADGTSHVLTVYGNTVGSGQMLSGLTRLLSSETNARSAPSFTLSTLYEENEYYIFSVFLLDEDETDPQRTVQLRSRFLTGQLFLDYTQELRARSMFNYPTDMADTDQVVLLTAPLSRSDSVLENGRIVVAGRRRRPGESWIRTTAITQNTDVIMPYRWYLRQHMTPHRFYTLPDGQELNSNSTTGSTFYDPFATDTTVTNIHATGPTSTTTTSMWIPLTSTSLEPSTTPTSGRTTTLPTLDQVSPTATVPTGTVTEDTTTTTTTTTTALTDNTEPDASDTTVPTPSDTTTPDTTDSTLSESTDPTDPTDPTEMTPVEEQ